MSAITIHREETKGSPRQFRAIAGRRQSVGRTAGEALDALNAEIGEDESASIVFVQQMASDPFFSEEQHLRMQDLLRPRQPQALV